MPHFFNTSYALKKIGEIHFGEMLHSPVNSCQLRQFQFIFKSPEITLQNNSSEQQYLLIKIY